ncbi:MAG: DUF1800 domain-containing protein [Alphaproteobacteria bacterium]|nr:DUF1800 domain-containing protein [Alphaproteobacteria bacterium]
MMSAQAYIALNRFGLGARPGEADALGDPARFLRDQVGNGAPLLPEFAAAPGSAQIMRELPERNRMRDMAEELLKQFRERFRSEMGLRFQHGFTSPTGFHERLVWFWANHFTISVTNLRMFAWPSSYEREAIRPHVSGRFIDMLLAVVRHPGMLLYLDNAQSIGPNSLAGKRIDRGLNENLAREILELHTLGVEGGYGQGDVLALAKILTGWSLKRGDEVVGEDAFNFFPNRHEPGGKTLLGVDYAEGYEEGVRALTALASHPSTARHVARKFARHFIADDPPVASVARLESVFNDTNGDLGALAAAVIEDEAAWQAEPRKMRAPVEYVTAAMRAFGGGAKMERKALDGLMNSCRLMGQFPYGAPSPKGWPDEAKAWAGPDAMLERVEWAHALAARLPQKPDASALARDILGPLMSEHSMTILARAADPVQGVALFLSSPEFQRR